MLRIVRQLLYPVRKAKHFAVAFLLATLFAIPANAQINDVQPPEPIPNGDTAFIASVRVSYQNLAGALRGRIYYTLDGSVPTANSMEYTEPFLIKQTSLLRSVRIRNGQRSLIHPATFTKMKAPKPAFIFEPKAEFTGVKKVTLTVDMGTNPSNGKAPVIYYSTDASFPDTLYTSTLNIGKTCVVKAWTTHPDFDQSLLAEQKFTLLVPAEKPVLNPKSMTFPTANMVVNFTSTTPNAFFQYSFGANSNPDSGTIGASAVVKGVTPGEVITLRVVAKKDSMAMSQIAEEKYTYQPLPASPVASPLPFTFQDTVTVSLSTTTPLSEIRYSTNGSLPTLTAARYDSLTKVRLDSTSYVRAMAYRAGWGSSDTYTGRWILALSAPTPSLGSNEFEDSIKFIINAKNPTASIHYTQNGIDPTASSPHYLRGDSITLSDDSTDFRVIAIKNGVKSPVGRTIYVKSNKVRATLPPAVEPAGRDFMDSLPVYLTPADPLSTVFYSLEGGPMTAWTGGSKPLVLKASATLRVFAQRAGRNPSEERLEDYVQVPPPPTADPTAEKSAENRLVVRLFSKVHGAEIWWLWDKQEFNLGVARLYNPETPLVFSNNTYLQAVAITGTGPRKRMSQVMVQDYVVLSVTVGDEVPPGQERSLSQNVAVVNKGTSALSTKLIPFEQLNLKGFSEASHAVIISAGAGQAVPKAEITWPGGQNHAVYTIVDGKVKLVSAVTPVTISKAGTYFAAFDILPPVLSILKMEPDPGLGTLVRMQVVDNVASTTVEVRGSGIADKLLPTTDSEGRFEFRVKNGPQELKDLWLTAQAMDGRNPGHFPLAGGSYYVPQIWSTLATPKVYSTGFADQPYDLVGLPIGSGSTLTWAQLKKDNPDPTLTAVVYKDGFPVHLNDADQMEPGIAFWLGSRNARSHLSLSKFQTAPSHEDGKFRVLARQGYTMVTNPSLSALYWPIARTDKNYTNQRLRSLWSYDTKVMDYEKVDYMLPWRGYWVLNETGKDTLVELLTSPKPVTKAAAEAEGSDASKVEILVHHGRPFPLRLGARGYAKDGVGVEDEPLLPYWTGRRQGWSARDKNRLMTDVLCFMPDQVMRWKLVLEGTPAAGRDSLVTFSDIRLPAGFEAWAYSRRRNLKVRVEAATGYSLPGAEADTLWILAGPAAKLASLPELVKAVERVDAFRSGIRPGRQGRGLFLALPSDAWVKAEIWTPAGRRVTTVLDDRLGSGQHFLPVSDDDRMRGARFLRLMVRGEGWTRNQVHVLSLP